MRITLPGRLQPKGLYASYISTALGGDFTLSALASLGPAVEPHAPAGFSMASMPRKSRKTYTRDDGALMIQIAPGTYVSEAFALKVGLPI